MKVVLKINKFIQDNILKWYYFISIYLVISLMNFGFISLIIPTWGCYIIEILLTGFLLYYIAVVYSFIRDKYKKYMISRMDHIDEQMLKMHQYINELDDKAEKQAYTSLTGRHNYRLSCLRSSEIITMRRT